MILPAIELQPRVQAVGKQGTAAATGTQEDTFSATFGANLRETAQGQSVQSGTEVDAPAPGDAGEKAVPGRAASQTVTDGLAAEIRSRVAEAASQVAKQGSDQASAGTLVPAAKTPASGLTTAIAETSARAAGQEVESGTLLPVDPKEASAGTTAAGTTAAGAKAAGEGKSNLARSESGDEGAEFAAAGSRSAASNAASARAETANVVSVAAGKPKVPDTAVDQGRGAATPGQSRAAEVAAAINSAAAESLPGAADTVKPDATALLKLQTTIPGAGKAADLKTGARFPQTTNAEALKAADSQGTLATQAGGDGAVVAAASKAGEQGSAQAAAAKTEIGDAAGAVLAAAASTGPSIGTSSGVVRAKNPVAVTAKAAGTSWKVQVPGAKTGVSAGLALSGKENLIQSNPAGPASPTDAGANALATAAVPTQTAAIELPVGLPQAAQATASNVISDAAGVGLPRPAQVDGKPDANKATSGRADNKAAVAVEGAEATPKSGVAEVASADSATLVATPIAAHTSAAQTGTASTQAVVAHVLPAAVSATSGTSSRSGGRSVAVERDAAQTVQGQVATPAGGQGKVPAVPGDVAAVAPDAVSAKGRTFNEVLRAADPGQQTRGVAAGQGLLRAAGNPAANPTSASASASPGSAATTPGAAPSVEAAPGIGVHAAGVPASASASGSASGSASTANAGNVGANPAAGIIAAGHPAATAGGVSPSSTGSAGSTGAGAVSSALSGVGGAARSDLASAVEPHRTLVATPTTLEVGVPDGTQGWLRIRAEVGDQGQVNASLAAGSGASQEMLHRELPALNAYLHNEQISATATVSERSFTSGGGVQAGMTDDQGRALNGGGAPGGGMTQGGPAGGQQGDAGRQGTAAPGSIQNYSGNTGLSEAAIANAGGLNFDDQSGRWLNVRA